jgi:hypothetical protein
MYAVLGSTSEYGNPTTNAKNVLQNMFQCGPQGSLMSTSTGLTVPLTTVLSDCYDIQKFIGVVTETTNLSSLSFKTPAEKRQISSKSAILISNAITIIDRQVQTVQGLLTSMKVEATDLRGQGLTGVASMYENAAVEADALVKACASYKERLLNLRDKTYAWANAPVVDLIGTIGLAHATANISMWAANSKVEIFQSTFANLKSEMNDRNQVTTTLPQREVEAARRLAYLSETLRELNSEFNTEFLANLETSLPLFVLDFKNVQYVKTAEAMDALRPVLTRIRNIFEKLLPFCNAYLESIQAWYDATIDQILYERLVIMNRARDLFESELGLANDLFTMEKSKLYVLQSTFSAEKEEKKELYRLASNESQAEAQSRLDAARQMSQTAVAEAQRVRRLGFTAAAVEYDSVIGHAGQVVTTATNLMNTFSSERTALQDYTNLEMDIRILQAEQQRLESAQASIRQQMSILLDQFTALEKKNESAAAAAAAAAGGGGGGTATGGGGGGTATGGGGGGAVTGGGGGGAEEEKEDPAPPAPPAPPNTGGGGKKTRMVAYQLTHLLFFVVSALMMIMGMATVDRGNTGFGITLIAFGLALLVWCISYLWSAELRDKVYV